MIQALGNWSRKTVINCFDNFTCLSNKEFLKAYLGVAGGK